MTRYIANANGDWWEYHVTQPLYLFDTDILTAEQFANIIDEHEGLENDKFEDVIMEHGVPVSLEAGIAGNELIEYIKVHIISLEQDLEDIDYGNSQHDYRIKQAEIDTAYHILSVAEDILES